MAVLRDTEYPTEYHSDQTELHNISLKTPHTLIQNDYPALGFLGYFTEISSKIIIFY